MSDEQPKYELITYDGDNQDYIGKKVRRYFSDGSIRNDRGQVIEKLPNNGHDITAENSREYSRKRWEKYQAAAASAVAAELGSANPGANTPFAAWGVLNARTAVAIMDSDKPRGRDLEYIGRNMGAIPTILDRESDESQDNDSTLAALGAELVRHLTDRARLARDDS